MVVNVESAKFVKMMYSNPSINTVNGSCMFGVLIESMLIEIKYKGH